MNALLTDIRELIVSARKAVVHSVDLIQVVTNFDIGRRIVEHEQQGAERAKYGKQSIQELAKQLTGEFGKGFSERNLRSMRKFYLLYSDRFPEEYRTSSGGLTINASLLRIWQMPSAKSSHPFTLSWSQYVFLTSIANGEERSFYEIEAAENSWTLPELRRQFDSGLYVRLALSRDKQELLRLSLEGQIVSRPEDLLKEPYILEFLGLEEKSKYSETELESAIIDNLEHFLLELGKGFLFEARQKRFTFDEDHFFVDLVFYNRLLRCYVLIDLKIGKLTHQNLGQMQMYVNYFDRFVKLADERPTIGINICRKKHDALVEITLPSDANIHAKEYQLYLPDKEQLREKLVQWSEDAERLIDILSKDSADT